MQSAGQTCIYFLYSFPIYKKPVFVRHLQWITFTARIKNRTKIERASKQKLRNRWRVSRSASVADIEKSTGWEAVAPTSVG